MTDRTLYCRVNPEGGMGVLSLHETEDEAWDHMCLMFTSEEAEAWAKTETELIIANGFGSRSFAPETREFAEPLGYSVVPVKVVRVEETDE